MGKKASLTYPDSTTYQYRYDDAKKLNVVTIPNKGNIIVNGYQWQAPQQITFPGGAVQRNTYDDLLRGKQINIQDPAKNNLMNYQYSYNAVGEIIEKNTQQGDFNYSYDVRGRLTAATHPTFLDEQYTYDAAGNRLTSAETGTDQWQYNDNNELLAAATNQYLFDSNGNMTSRTVAGQTQNFIYNLENRLSEVRSTDNTVIAEYIYDPFGRRLSKTVASVTTYYHYSDEGLIAEYDATGSPIQFYGYNPNGLWGTYPIFTRIGSEYYYYLNDHLGTPQKLLGGNGAAQWSSEQTSFGDTVVDAASTIINHMRFPGQYYDEETGLHYNRYRYYDPAIGRYITNDPLDLLASNNGYAYAASSPINLIDNEGLVAPIIIVGLIAGGTGGICAAIQNGWDPCEIFFGAVSGVAGAFLGFLGGFIADQVGAQACADPDDNRCKKAIEAGAGSLGGEIFSSSLGSSSKSKKGNSVSARDEIRKGIAGCLGGSLFGQVAGFLF